MRDVPAFARADMEPKVRAAYGEARAVFAGRGPDVARHFLTHTGFPPAADAYLFVLEAVADTDTAVVLVRALWDPPAVVAGPEIKVGTRRWLRERDKSEIHWAIVSVLVDDAVRSDGRVVAALREALDRLRPRDRRLGAGDAGMVVELLGRCTSAAATALLQELANDPDATIRGLAVQGLGQSGGAVKRADAGSTLTTIARTLQADPDPRARVEAATALGRLGAADAVAPLRAALDAEREPQVVDAIVLALGQLGAPITDPRQCGNVVARTWEVHAARPLFACWRASVTPDALREAALTGPVQVRALALYALVEKAAEYRPVPLVNFVPAPAPPPALAPPGARAMVNDPRQRPRPTPRPRIDFDDGTRHRLLASAVEILSRPNASVPGRRGEIASSTAHLVQDAMWEIADRDMATALRYADRISTPGAPSFLQGRYSMSYGLSHKDSAAYLAVRRPRQAAFGAIVAAAFGLLLVWSPTRRAGASLVIAALGWSVSSLFASALRELPPPPLQWLTVTALGFMSAGVSVAAVALVSRRTAPGGVLGAIGRGSGATVLATVLAFFACGWTRWSRVFPIGGEGWELIFDPIGSAIVAAMVAVALAVVDRVLFRRWFSDDPPRAEP